MKMPAFPSISRPGLVDIKWYTGVVTSTFAPSLPPSIKKPEGMLPPSNSGEAYFWFISNVHQLVKG